MAAVAALGFAVGGAAVGLSTYYTGRLFIQHPDIVLNTKERAMTTRDNHEYGHKFTEHSVRKASAKRGLKDNNYQIAAGINNAFTTPRAPGSY